MEHRSETEPSVACPLHSAGAAAVVAAHGEIQIARPSPGPHLALDPRIPDEFERFALELEGLPKGARVEWWIDDAPFAGLQRSREVTRVCHREVVHAAEEVVG